MKNTKKINIIYIIIAVLFLYQMLLLGIYITSYKEISAATIVISVFFFLTGLVIDSIVLYVYQSIRKKLEMDEELKELYRYREQEMLLYKNIQLQIDQLREQRHEFANQIQTAYIMLEQNAPLEMLEKYLQDLEKNHQVQ